MSRYRTVSERIDRATSSWQFLVAFNVAVALALCWSMNAANVLMSIVTADLVLFGAGLLRRAWAALHAKLDVIIKALPGASDALLRAEDREEFEIEALRCRSDEEPG